mgnify:CR=1 FL=1
MGKGIKRREFGVVAGQHTVHPEYGVVEVLPIRTINIPHVHGSLMVPLAYLKNIVDEGIKYEETVSERRPSISLVPEPAEVNGSDLDKSGGKIPGEGS